jgi:hypothetical protein
MGGNGKDCARLWNLLTEPGQKIARLTWGDDQCRRTM